MPAKPRTKQRSKPQTSTLEVTLHDEAGEPRTKMRVQLTNETGESVERLTDKDGSVEFPDLRIGGTYHVRVNGDEEREEILIERSKESLELQYDGELVDASDDDEDKHPDEKEEDEDLDSVSDDHDLLI